VDIIQFFNTIETSNIFFERATPCLIVTTFAQRITGFYPTVIDAGFMVDKVAVKQGFSEHIHLSVSVTICHQDPVQ
jgi:hypothetical protein